jgi:hypothetical protein
MATKSGTDVVMLLNDVIRIDAGELDFGGHCRHFCETRAFGKANMDRA